MPSNDQSNRKIDFLNIDCESNYFNTQEQVRKKKTRWFTETTAASMLSGSSEVVGLFSRVRIVKDDAVYNSPVHATASTTIDPSGASRKILASNIDYYSSSSYDSYRNGIEITEDKHWVSGLSKISAGTPGHLFDPLSYGYSETSVISEDEFVEIDPFDPVKYVATGGDPTYFTYPIITSDYNQVENYILNGIIEPFPIRPVISNFSINFPFEPHSVRGDFGCGNINMGLHSDQIVSVDYYDPERQNATPFLDALSVFTIATPDATFVGPTLGYFNTDENVHPPYDDQEVFPRGEPLSGSYGQQLSSAVQQMPLQGETYVSRGKRSATSGYVYDNTPQGTDSITYGGLLH